MLLNLDREEPYFLSKAMGPGCKTDVILGTATAKSETSSPCSLRNLHRATFATIHTCLRSCLPFSVNQFVKKNTRDFSRRRSNCVSRAAVCYRKVHQSLCLTFCWLDMQVSQ